jgi:YD repeat-containing protein
MRIADLRQTQGRGRHARKTTCHAMAAQSNAQTWGQLPLVVLKGGKKKMLLGPNPALTLFPGAIDCVIARPPPSIGDPVLVVDGGRESVLAYGIYNPESTFAVRILEFFGKSDFDGDRAYSGEYLEGLIGARLRVAAELRTRALALGGVTSAWRLCNAEGDNLPGLVVDVFGSVAVVQSSAAWIEARRVVVETCLREMGLDVIWRPALDMLALEGIDIDMDVDMDMDMNEETQGRKIIVEEHGVKFEVDPGGQKTGFYCDQRDNRVKIHSIAQGKSVADICCYSGGFGIHAAVGGARRVVGVDSSQQAVDLAATNAALNGVDAVCDFVKQDASAWMDAAIDAGEKFDIVVLDPPKLAPSRKSLVNATRKYVSLNTRAMKLVRDGGILMTCSCSGAMTQSHTFRSAVIAASAGRAGVQASLLSKAGAGGDHVIDPRYPEGEYLSNYMVRICTRISAQERV